MCTWRRATARIRSQRLGRLANVSASKQDLLQRQSADLCRRSDVSPPLPSRSPPKSLSGVFYAPHRSRLHSKAAGTHREAVRCSMCNTKLHPSLRVHKPAACPDNRLVDDAGTGHQIPAACYVSGLATNRSCRKRTVDPVRPLCPPCAQSDCRLDETLEAFAPWPAPLMTVRGSAA